MPDRIRAVVVNEVEKARPRMTLATLFAATLITGVLHVGQEIFLPLAIAVLITFALSPLVDVLRNRGLPRLLAVLGTVTVAFAAIGIFLLIVVSQLGQLARQLPTFQANIVTKLEAIRSSGEGTGIGARLSRIIGAINDEIGSALPQDAGTGLPVEPLPVRVIEPSNALGTLLELVLSLVGPVAMAGLVVVVVIFMLLERNELRDRFIRLVGANDIHRMTQVLEDAGGRVGRYLIGQLLVNAVYALPIGVGLWLIGVPNALLWGLLTLVLRFVPYIGTVLAAAFPLFLAFAVAPGWSVLLWTAALFLVVELITSNLVEPWVYGSRTGLSSLAIIVAAIFWTWVWGPMGLVMSTPLTVCLVVLGRHVPQFEIFAVLFGDRPVLAPEARLYQRFLAGDAIESTFRAEEALEEVWLADYYRDVALPALMLAQTDYERGVVNTAQEERLAQTAMRVLDDLDEVAEEERQTPDDEGDVPHPGAGRQLLCLGGRTVLDDVTARMLAQAATAEGAEAKALSHVDLTPARFAAVTESGVDVVLVCHLDLSPARGAVLQVRRIKWAMPEARVGLVIWQSPDGLAGGPRRPDGATLRAIMEAGADFCVTTLEAALSEAFADRAPLPLTAPRRKTRSRRLRRPPAT
ncbi:MAG: AI-2E family transporter [Rhodobacteraceae bacterium]|nr:AI-2E family transporter [Paracoccaceae bacterium]